MIQGKEGEITDAERLAFIEEAPNMARGGMGSHIMKMAARRYGSAWLNALVTARTEEERWAVWEWAKEREAKLKAEGND